MKIGKKLTVFFLLSIVLFVTITITTLAWTNNTYILSQNVIGKSRKSYFGGGDGTSLTPFIISEPEHFFNLSYLQNLGQFTGTTYYFEVTNSVDFDNAAVDLYKTIDPIGSGDYPFVGELEGNFYTISNFSVDGNGKQDIGVFGNLGDNAVVQNLFIEQPTILSNPSTSDDKTNYHGHYDDIQNRATGYICGHLAEFALLDNVFIVGPTIDSSTNGDSNRSQYGLIGYNEFDGGLISGSPRTAYNFDMDAVSSKAALAYAYTTYGSTLINGSSTLTLSDVLSSVGFLADGYALSTILIPDPDSQNDPAPQGSGNLIFLYDQLVADGYTIGANGSEYSRENVDVVGEIEFGTTSYQIFQNIGTSGLQSPVVGTTFDANNFPHAIFLYVRPTNDPNDLGEVTGTYGGGGQLSYLSSYDSSGNYVPNRTWKNSQDPNLVNFGSSGVTQTMTASAAFAAVQRDVLNTVTGEYTYKVVDETVTPDFYVFLVAVTNGQITISDINFQYQPQSATPEDFESLGNIDYITVDEKAGIIADASSYSYSYFYFNYDVTVNQTIEIYTEKLWDSNTLEHYYNLYIDYAITDSSVFYFDIYNINNSVVNIYVNDVFDSGNPYSLIAIQFTASSYTVTTS